MKIIYIANARIPTEKAHGLQIMKMCEAFSGQGHDVLLLVPFRFNKIEQNPFDFYNVKRNFKITKVFSLDLLPFEKFFGKFAFYIQSLSFGLRALIYANSSSTDFIYCRDNILLMFLLKTGKKIIYEAHVFSEKVSRRQIDLWKQCHKITTITNGLKKLFEKQGIESNKILVAPDGVDSEQFDIKASREECRKKLGLPLNKKIVLYAGHLYKWKGAETLTQSLEYLDNDYLVKIVIGRPHKEIPYWLKSADVLVLPNTAKEKISRIYTSPLKLFEYMASGTPIVASDIPSIREIVSEREVCFVEPDSPQALAKGIKKVLNNPEKAKKIAEHTKEVVKKYTWQKRAETILNNI